MNYRETLFFIGKCLTINHEEHNKVLVEEDLKNDKVNWDNIVKVSTSHFVFPALYCNLKKADFLHYLPEDLVEYMVHITNLNRERNEQIIIEAKEINKLLLANNITPIFLKGTGNLLEDLYDDIAERMVGDIDLIVDKKDADKAFKLFKNRSYEIVGELYEDHRHLPRLTHPDKIAAIEIHKEMLKKEKSMFFNFNHIKNSIISIGDIHLLSLENQIKLTVFAKFINDDAYKIKSVSLRAAYDVFLQFKNNKKNLIIEKNELSKELNAGIATYLKVLNISSAISFDEETLAYTKQSIQAIDKSKKNQTNYLFLKKRFIIILKAFTNKSYFKFVYSKFTDRKWYKKRFGI